MIISLDWVLHHGVWGHNSCDRIPLLIYIKELVQILRVKVHLTIQIWMNTKVSIRIWTFSLAGKNVGQTCVPFDSTTMLGPGLCIQNLARILVEDLASTDSSVRSWCRHVNSWLIDFLCHITQQSWSSAWSGDIFVHWVFNRRLLFANWTTFGHIIFTSIHDCSLLT